MTAAVELLRDLKSDLPRFAFTAASLIAWRVVNGLFQGDHGLLGDVLVEGATLLGTVLVVWIVFRGLTIRPVFEIQWINGGVVLDGPSVPLLSGPDSNVGMFAVIKVRYHERGWLPRRVGRAALKAGGKLTIAFTPKQALSVRIDLPTGGAMVDDQVRKELTLNLDESISPGDVAWPSIEVIPAATPTPVTVAVSTSITIDSDKRWWPKLLKVVAPVKAISIPVVNSQ